MARKTNKTDHVLNLLSSGKKAGTGKEEREEKDTPPVDLRRKKPEQAPEDLPDVEPQPEGQDIGMERMPLEESQELPQQNAVVEKPQPRETPEVSVVRPAVDEKAIADAVKNSLESELNAYLQEKEAAEEAANPAGESLIDRGNEPAKAVMTQEHIADPKPELTVAFPKVAEKKSGLGINISELMEEETQVPAEQEAGGAEEAPLQENLQILPKEEPVLEPEPPAPLQEEPERAEVPQMPLQPVKEDAVPQEQGAVLEVETMPETDPQAVAQTTEPVPEPELPEKTELDVLAEEAAPQEQPEVTEEAAPETAVQEEEKSSEPEVPTSSQEESVKEKDFVMVNVMEHLVREQVPQYIRQFGHCDCERCIEDTIALTLTHLPAKYVVVNKNAVSPLLNFYEKRYAGQLIVEITKSTMIVNGSPHHE